MKSENERAADVPPPTPSDAQIEAAAIAISILHEGDLDIVRPSWVERVARIALEAAAALDTGGRRCPLVFEITGEPCGRPLTHGVCPAHGVIAAGGSENALAARVPDRVMFDARGIGWRWFADMGNGEPGFSMVPVTDDNLPMPEPWTWFVPESFGSRQRVSQADALAEAARRVLKTPTSELVAALQQLSRALAVCDATKGQNPCDDSWHGTDLRKRSPVCPACGARGHLPTREPT